MLNSIVEKKKAVIAKDKQQESLEQLQQQLTKGDFSFSKALKENEWSLIAECKLASPSKGILCDNYTTAELAKIYAENGATVLSVHTDNHFKGELKDLRTISSLVSIPVLRKEFIIDEYQIYQARAYGAAAILLIAAILTKEQLQHFLDIAKSLGLDCLVEVHDEAELEMVLQTNAEIIGINNRNLKIFKTDINNTVTLMKKCPPDKIVISDSGLNNRNDIEKVKACGVRGVLIGEGLVKATDIPSAVKEFLLQ